MTEFIERILILLRDEPHDTAIKKQLVQYLKELGSTLDFSKRYSVFKLHPEDIKHLLKALQEIPNIKKLNLKNCINNNGVIALSIELAKNTTLIELDLSYNQINDEGMTILSEKLEVNKTLKKLHLGGNIFSSTAIMRLSKMLKINSTLKYLNLNYPGNFQKPRENEINTNIDIDIELILSLVHLVSPSHLEVLELGYYAFSEDSILPIATSIFKHPHLKKVYFSGPYITPKAIETLAHFIRTLKFPFISPDLFTIIPYDSDEHRKSCEILKAALQTKTPVYNDARPSAYTLSTPANTASQLLEPQTKTLTFKAPAPFTTHAGPASNLTRSNLTTSLVSADSSSLVPPNNRVRPKITSGIPSSITSGLSV